jgi:hypothetical protein
VAVRHRSGPFSGGREIAGHHRDDVMDGKIQAGDVVVSHVNGTFDFYIIATVLSAVGDLTLSGISTMKGENAAIVRGYEQQKDGQAVWLFAGSAGAYVKAPLRKS